MSKTLIDIFDTHTHDYFNTFDTDRTEMIEQDFSSGVIGKVQIGCDIPSSQTAIDLSKQYPKKCFATVGIHPCHVEENFNNLENAMEQFQDMITQNKEIIVGVGETGFDFFHNDSPQLRHQQEMSFIYHCQLAQKNNLALVIHTRGARDQTLQFFKDHKKWIPQKAVIHCFSEDADFAKEVTNEYGYFLGIGGVCTYKKNNFIREAIKKTDIQYIVTETDSPFLAPESVRGSRNQSRNIYEILLLISEIKGISLQKCSELVLQNAKRLLGLQ